MAKTSDPFLGALACAAELTSGMRRAAVSDVEAAELEAVMAEIGRFVDTRVDPIAIERRGALGPELLHEMGALGLFGLGVPTSFGGSGLSLKAIGAVVERLARGDGSLAACVGLHNGLGLYGLLHHASPKVQAYLPAIARGECVVAFAATEPSAGSDIAAVRTELAAHGGQLRLNGEKCYVTNGGIAGLVTVLARSPGLGGARAGTTLVAVPTDARGLGRGREEHKLGLRGSSTLTLTFDDLVVTDAQLLGEPGRGLEIAQRALAWGRTVLSSGCLGTARGALAQARAHVEARSQFGGPLFGKPLVRAVLAESDADLYAVESVLRLVGELQARGADVALPSTIAKILASETAFRVVDRSLQLMGGAGYVEDTGMARRLRDVRVTRIFEGSNDVLRLHLATSVLGWKLGELRRREAFAGIPGDTRAIESNVGWLCDALGAACALHGVRIVQAQTLLARMADGIVAAFSALAVRLRQGDGTTAREAALAALATDRAERRLALALTALADDTTTSRGWIETIVGTAP